MNDAVVIIGGGPAGLFCALEAAGEGERVIVFEKKPAPARKLLVAGSGQCNITHDGEIAGFLSHYGDHGAFLRPALMNFTNRDLIAFFAARGLGMKAEPGGKVFPETRKSSDVLDVLLTECAGRGVELRRSEPVVAVERDGDGFLVRTERGVARARVLVLATGGASYPATGSTGDGYAFARALGQPVTEIAPALTPVYVADYPFADLAGISFEKAGIAVYRGGRLVRRHTGDLLLTHTGLSGPGILDLSRSILAGDVLRVTFLPEASAEAVRKRVADAIAAGGARQAKTVLSALPLPERFARRLLDLSGVSPGESCAHLGKKARSALAASVAEFPFSVARLGGFAEAMATRGGVALDGINPRSMASKTVQNLYCIGEVLDIDGDTGGYNLQAAFSTAALAARHIAGTKSSR
ncbi:NAD(P)/FAD-dependent oxidoreductase [Methanoculleus sp. Wushi-C6]|uniref:NAD(P)/FAD-dependent oxidoreductase n=1 Tax=Methanoculleus caldifontis TaxID=2651577 RepID=A0ABU3WYT1_9EURY|nr:NAD(P)/FAD-dependent oxidoreductase [Methanoculleus sp. Wushi-C6]MDV2480954.1 NAD(P)/FAD-dependent oxidoreductase [Methanoculleus sp. Wushi-C6]